jgi:hypothetical protein
MEKVVIQGLANPESGTCDERVLELVAFPPADGALSLPVFVKGTQRVYRVRIDHSRRDYRFAWCTPQRASYAFA